MAKNKKQILEHPLMVILISLLAIVLILSLQESKQKALIDSSNLEQNRENIELIEQKVEQKAEYFEQVQDDLYKEKIRRNELVKNKIGETVILIPETNFESTSLEETTLDKTDYRVQNWKSWWQLLTNKE